MSNNKRTLVPMVDLKKEIYVMKDQLNQTLNEVLDSGRFILGKKVKELEIKLASYVGCDYGIGVANGTDALQLALLALDIGKGDEVITTPFTFFATAEAIAQVGAKPVFVDIDEQTYNMDPTELEEVINKNTKAIIVVHLYGKVADMHEIFDVAKKYNLKVIEDACQAIGAEYEGKKAGSMGDVGCFSFFPSKNLGAFGDAGFITTNETKLYNIICKLRNHGSDDSYIHKYIGMNSRLDEMQAAILLNKLDYLDIFLHQRKEIAKRYTENLELLTKVPEIPNNNEHVFHQYCIQLEKRDDLKKKLENKGIASTIYYPIPLHLQEAFHYLNYKEGDFPIAEHVAKSILALPISPMLSIKDQKYVIQTVQSFFNEVVR